MRGPTDNEDVYAENHDLREQNRILREQLADVLDESHNLHEQVERQLTYIAELEADLAKLKAL